MDWVSVVTVKAVWLGCSYKAISSYWHHTEPEKNKRSVEQSLQLTEINCTCNDLISTLLNLSVIKSRLNCIIWGILAQIWLDLKVSQLLPSGTSSSHFHTLIETAQSWTDQSRVWVPPLMTDVILLNNNDDKSICVTECPRRNKLKDLRGSLILCGGQWELREKHNLSSKHWLVNNGLK